MTRKFNAALAAVVTVCAISAPTASAAPSDKTPYGKIVSAAVLAAR